MDEKNKKKRLIIFNMPRQEFINRLIALLSVFLIFSGVIVFYFVYKPLKIELEKSLVENFQQLSNIRYISLQNDINQGLEGARSISSRSAIREAILEYEGGEIKLGELKKTTQKKYEDGAKALENLMKAERYVGNKIIASYYAEEYVEEKDEKWNKQDNITEKDYKIDLVDDREYLSILSPIYADKKIVGYDELLFDLSSKIRELCTEEINTKIVEKDQMDELLDNAKIIENTEDTTLFSKGNYFYKAFHMQSSNSLIVREDKKNLLEPIYDSTHNILLTGFGALILYTLISYFVTLWHANKKLDNSQMDLDSALYKVNTDKLTGVYSRAYGEELLEFAYEQFQIGENSPAIFVFDINSLKKVNDEYGHLAGDLVIRTIAQSLANNVREEDKIFRWGGDEFIGVFYDVGKNNTAGLSKKLENLIYDLKIKTEKDTIDPSISIGYSYFLEDDHKYTDAVRRADEAMYREKFNKKSSKI